MLMLINIKNTRSTLPRVFRKYTSIFNSYSSSSSSPLILSTMSSTLSATLSIKSSTLSAASSTASSSFSVKDCSSASSSRVCLMLRLILFLSVSISRILASTVCPIVSSQRCRLLSYEQLLRCVQVRQDQVQAR